MNIVENEPGLPNPPAAFAPAWSAQLVKRLTTLLRDLALRANGTLPKDGTEAMTAPLVLPTYTVATRPTATSGQLIYVSDGAAGARFQGSHANAWINLG